MKRICLLLLAGLCGCQMQADAVKTGATLTCVDTRDGERFSFKDESIRDAAYGLGADSCMTVTDNAGKERRLCKSHEAFLKCEKSPAPPNAV